MINQDLYNPKIKANPQLERNELRRPCCCRPYNFLVCYDAAKKLAIPLKSVNYNIKILRGIAIVEIEQIYSTNEYEQPVDIEYLFTISDNAVLTKMIVELGDIQVIGVIKEKEEAKQEYEQGIQQGKTMAYCEQDENFPEIKNVKLGQLAPQKKLQVTFEYIQPLEVCFNQFWKVEISPMIDQTYLSLNPEIDYQQKLFKKISNHVNLKGRKLDFKQDFIIMIDTGSKIQFVQSPTHRLLYLNAKNIQDEQPKKLEMVLEDIHQNFTPFKQFTLLFATEDINIPTAILSHTNNDALYDQKYCATLSFIPKFNQVPLNDAYQQYLDGLNIPVNQKFAEYIFFIDRSGSMKGDRIQKAKQSLELFLKSLPEDSYFNIISFGSVYRAMWGRTEKYSQQTLEEAINHVSKMSADMNGTEIFKPLYEVIYNQDYNKRSILNIFVLTDGEVSPKPIIDLVQKFSVPKTHVYTLGIGEGCSQYLIKRLAEVGNGKCQFVSDTNQINEKVIDLLEDSLTPQLEQFNINCNANNIQRIIPNPNSILCIKKNEQFLVQILFQAEQIIEKIDFEVQFHDPQEQRMINYSVSINLNDSILNDYFHKLAAFKYINYYEKAQKNGDLNINFVKTEKNVIDDQDIVNESIVHQILCSKTAFICEVCNIEDQFKNQERQKIKVNTIKQEIQASNERSVTSLSLAKPSHLLYKEEPKRPQVMERAMPEKKCAPVSSLNKMVKSKQVEETEDYKPNDIQLNIQLDKNTQILNYVDIIQFAQADGCFLIPQQFQIALQFDKIENYQKINLIAWNTFLTLLFLEIKCTQHRKSWQLIFQKEIQYLSKNGVIYKELKEIYLDQYSMLIGIKQIIV